MGIRKSRKTATEGTSSKKKKTANFADILMELEQRIAFDAAGAVTADEAAHREPAPAHASEAVDSNNESAKLAKALASRASDEPTSERDGDERWSRLSALLSAPDKREANPVGDTIERLGHDLSGNIKTDRIGPPEQSASHEPVDTVLLPGEAPERTEIVFIDGSVQDFETIKAGLSGNAEIIILDPNRDAVEQMAEALEGRSDIDAIHIISHGQAGALVFGTGGLDERSINGKYAEQLAEIGAALTVDGDILLYGCDFGAGENGRTAVAALAAVTKADVAASIDSTGHASLGGNWVLELHEGLIETKVAVDANAQDAWLDALVKLDINPAGGAAADGSDGLRIHVTDLGQIQVVYQNQAQLYGPTRTDTNSGLFNGIYIAVGDKIIGPAHSGISTTVRDFVWKSAAPQTLTGTGTEADPFVVTTRLYHDVDNNNLYNPAVDFLVTVQTFYEFPNKYFTENITVTPPPGNTAVVKVYHSMDTYLAGGDQGPAFSLDTSLAITGSTTGDPSFVGVRKAVGTPNESIVGFARVQDGRHFDRYFSGSYGTAFSALDNGGDLPNTWNTNPNTDNGISVQFTLGAINTSQSLSYHIAFDGDTKLDLDANNSTASGNAYAGTFQAGAGGSVPIVDSDVEIINTIGDISHHTDEPTGWRRSDRRSEPVAPRHIC